MIFEKNSRPLKYENPSAKVSNDSVIAYIECIKVFLMKINNSEMIKVIRELEKKYKEEVEKYNFEIKSLKIEKQDKEDYHEILNQCQALEESMTGIIVKCEKYHEKIKNQEILISRLRKANRDLEFEAEYLKEKV